jgi:hypothetical protein
MKLQNVLHASRTSSGTGGIGVARALRRCLAFTMALLLLPVSQVQLFAQQCPCPGQYGPYQPPVYGQQPYYSPSSRLIPSSSPSTTVADWGFAHGGRRAFNGFNRGEGGYGRGGYNAGYRQEYARGPQGFASNRPEAARPAQQAYNRMQPAINSAYGRPVYGSSFAGGSYNNRPQGFYGNWQPAYRAPAVGFQNREFAQRSSMPVGNKGYSG